jgi:hypothetical protein
MPFCRRVRFTHRLAGAKSRIDLFAMPFNLILKVPSFYQDRLGTNIGKALKKEMMHFSHRIRLTSMVMVMVTLLLLLRQLSGVSIRRQAWTRMIWSRSSELVERRQRLSRL